MLDLTSDPQDWEIIPMCSFKLLNLLQFVPAAVKINEGSGHKHLHNKCLDGWMNIKEYTFEAELRSFFISHILLLVSVSFCHITNNYKYKQTAIGIFLLFTRLQHRMGPVDLGGIQAGSEPSFS